VRRGVLILLALVLLGRPARAEGEFESVGAAVAYIVPIGCSAITSVASGAYMAVGEGAPMYLRTTGVVCGIAGIGVGTYLLITDNDTPGRIALGVLPVVAGAAAIITAILVGAPQDIVGNNSALEHVVPVAFQGGGGGLGFTTTF
jgi:hypothetical protein